MTAGTVARTVRAAGARRLLGGLRQVNRAPRALVVWVVARCCAYPLRVGVFAGTAVVVFVGWEWWLAAATAAVIVAVGLQVLAVGILRRSLRDPFELNPLVKSLRLRSRVRRKWPRAMHRAGLSKANKGGESSTPRHAKRIDVTALGVTTRVNMAPIGATADELRAKRRSLEASFRAADSRVLETGPGWAQLDLRHTDPLKRKITTKDLPPPTRRGFVVVGLDEDGIGVEKELRLPSLIIGAQGSGKSTEVWTTIRALIHSRIPFRLRVFDPKGGQEFTELADVAYQYERNPLLWGKFLGAALGGLVTRQQELAAQGIRNLNWYTDENPLDLMVIDELVTVSAFKAADVIYNDRDGRHTLKAPEALMLYLSQARSAGYSMLALSQLAQKQVTGPAIMDLFGYKTLLRVGSDEVVDMVLGPGKSKQYPAHLLPQDEASAGVGFVDTRGPRGVVKYRAARLSDAERRAVVRQVGQQLSRQSSARGAES